MPRPSGILIADDEAEALRAETRQLRLRLRDKLAPRNIIGASPAMRHIFEIVEQVAPSKATVLITGESGTGKALIASALHQRSARCQGPFIKLFCAGMAERLLESELFGRDGHLQTADGGTLFLDEIGATTPAVQVKLLRFLQDHEFERVGSAQLLRVDVRVLAATTKDLAQEVAAGRFREDLYQRLNLVSLEMPSLRDRRSDIPALARCFLDRNASEHARPLELIEPDALEVLTAYDWPGNVRELENAIERAVVRSRGSTLEARDLLIVVQPTQVAASGAPAVPGASLAELEKYAILETLRSTGGSTSRAAEILGVSVRTIQYRLHEYSGRRASNPPAGGP